jgi:hypothetical protein
MKIIYKYRTVLAVVLPILILVLFRLLNPNQFKPDVKQLATPSFDQMNLISSESISTLAGEKLFIALDQSDKEEIGVFGKVITIPADSIVSKKSLKTVRNHEGPVLLFSEDPALSARIWMVLSQMGIRDIFIFTNRNNEVLKYKFRPDTITGPEL